MRLLRTATCTSGEPVSVLWIRNCVMTLLLASPASAIRKSILLVYFLIVYVSLKRITHARAPSNRTLAACLTPVQQHLALLSVSRQPCSPLEFNQRLSAPSEFQQ